MEDLVASMTQDSSVERPPIEHVLQEFSRIRGSLSKNMLRSKLRDRQAHVTRRGYQKGEKFTM